MSARSKGARESGATTQKLTHERGPGASLVEWALRIVLFTNLILIPMALFAMGEESGPAASLKYLLVGFAAAAAAYGVSKFAVERLAPLHAIGFHLAGAVAIAGILLTGSGTALGSFTGITFNSVEAKIYQEAGQDLTAFIASANDAVLVAGRIGPAVEGVGQDIERTAACEIQSSCLSNVGSGGRGPMSRALEALSGQAFAIAEALQEGALERDDLLEDLNRLNAEYFEELADSGGAMADRRASLQSIHAEIRQVAAALMETMPIALVQGYVTDLRAGASVAGNTNGSRVLSSYMREHGDALAAQLEDLPETESVAPVFPDRPGMIEVLKYLPVYLAIAAIVIVGELCLPITLYLMTWLRLSWEIERRQEVLKPEPEADGFDGLIDLSERPYQISDRTS